jgi:hypothetical protein
MDDIETQSYGQIVPTGVGDGIAKQQQQQRPYCDHCEGELK